MLNVLDTSKGILVHTPLGESKSIDIPFVLADAEMEMSYQKMLSTEYFGYPSEVRVRGESPASTFRLAVVNGEITNDVKWTSDLESGEPNFGENDKLLQLYIYIQQIIHSHAEYPRPTAACA